MLYGPFTLSTYKHWLNCRDEFEQELLNRGIHRYYALVDSPEKFRWCEFLGMKSAYIVFNDKIELMVRNF